MADRRAPGDVHAPVEDLETPLGVKLLVFALVVALLLEVAALVLAAGLLVL